MGCGRGLSMLTPRAGRVGDCGSTAFFFQNMTSEVELLVSKDRVVDWTRRTNYWWLYTRVEIGTDRWTGVELR